MAVSFKLAVCVYTQSLSSFTYFLLCWCDLQLPITPSSVYTHRDVNVHLLRAIIPAPEGTAGHFFTAGSVIEMLNCLTQRDCSRDFVLKN